MTLTALDLVSGLVSFASLVYAMSSVVELRRAERHLELLKEDNRRHERLITELAQKFTRCPEDDLPVEETIDYRNRVVVPTPYVISREVRHECSCEIDPGRASPAVSGRPVMPVSHHCDACGFAHDLPPCELIAAAREVVRRHRLRTCPDSGKDCSICELSKRFNDDL